ncbi:hypothetical protein Hanom_Chr09g00764551 [Helianthus anomalus]
MWKVEYGRYFLVFNIQYCSSLGVLKAALFVATVFFFCVSSSSRVDLYNISSCCITVGGKVHTAGSNL